MGLFDPADLPALGPPARRAGDSRATRPKTVTALAKAAAQLKNAVGEVRPGESIHYATAGDWSTHDLLLHLIGQIGPAHVTASTWSISEPAVRHLVRALADGRILSLRMLVDWARAL